MCLWLYRRRHQSTTDLGTQSICNSCETHTTSDNTRRICCWYELVFHCVFVLFCVRDISWQEVSFHKGWSRKKELYTCSYSLQFYPTPFYPVLSCPILLYLILSYPIVSYRVLSYLALSYCILS